MLLVYGFTAKNSTGRLVTAAWGQSIQDYALNLYLRQSWKDPRLQFRVPADMTEKLDQIKMAEGKWNHLWLPDTFFRNEKDATYHDVTVANRLLRINASGHVWYTSK